MPSSRRVTSAGLLFALLALVAAACAGERPSLRDGAAREVEQPDGDRGGDSPPTTAAPVESLTLRLGVGTEWGGDPATAGPASVVTRVIADLLHEGLTSIGSDGAVAPALAERWFVTEDRLQWTFVLGPGVVDGDGEPITARDVKISLERVAARGAADQASSGLTAVTGWNDFVAGESGGVAGISAADATTLVLQLDRPFETLADVLASPAFGVYGETDDGTIRTTGAYRYTDDATLLAALDPDAAVQTIELVRFDGDGSELLATNRVDWIVLAGLVTDELPGDVIRQPLDLRVGVAVRVADRAERVAVLGAMVPGRLVDGVPWLNPLVNPLLAELNVADLPAEIVVDVPAGPLSSFAEGIAAELRSLGVVVVTEQSNAQVFAERIAAGDATVFPVVLAGDSFGAGAVLRSGAPGGIDDVFGPASAERAELVAAIEAEINSDRRAVLLLGLEEQLRAEGLLVAIGQYEVRIGVGPDVRPLRMRADGTLDLSGFDQPPS